MAPLREHQASVLQARGWAQRGRLHAIVDATALPSVPARARAAGPERAVSLYKGRAEEDFFAIAPYLFDVDADTLDWISGELWPHPWGIFLVTDASLEELRDHFRHFLTVESPAGESWYFRFYDPRVLQAFLATATTEEAEAFSGPVRGFAVTDPETYGLKVLTTGTTPALMRTPMPQRVVVQP